MVTSISGINAVIEKLKSKTSTSETEAAASSLFGSTASGKLDVVTISSSANTSSSGNEVERIRTELNANKEKKTANEKRISTLQKEVEALQEKIQAQINEAIKKADDLENKQKNEMESKSAEILKNYTNREISHEEMMAQIKEGFQNISSAYSSQITEAVGIVTSANTEMETLKSNVGEITCLTEENMQLGIEITKGEIALYTAINRAEGRDKKEGANYSADELDKAGVKVAVSENGSIVTKSLSELDINNIDLSKGKINSKTDKSDNMLLGTFGLTMGGDKAAANILEAGKIPEKYKAIQDAVKGSLTQTLANLNVVDNFLAAGKTEKGMKAEEDMKVAEEDIKKEDKEQEEKQQKEQEEKVKNDLLKKMAA